MRTCGHIPCRQPNCARCDPDYVEPPLEATDPLYASLVAATPYLDANWRLAPGGPLKPSEILSLRYCIESTNHRIGIGRAHREAGARLRAALEEARRRYRDGFFADPLGEPVRRPA